MRKRDRHIHVRVVMTTCEHSSVYDNSGKSVLVVRIVLLLCILLFLFLVHSFSSTNGFAVLFQVQIERKLQAIGYFLQLKHTSRPILFEAFQVKNQMWWQFLDVRYSSCLQFLLLRCVLVPSKSIKFVTLEKCIQGFIKILVSSYLCSSAKRELIICNI